VENNADIKGLTPGSATYSPPNKIIRSPALLQIVVIVWLP